MNISLGLSVLLVLKAQERSDFILIDVPSGQGLGYYPEIVKERSKEQAKQRDRSNISGIRMKNDEKHIIRS